METEREFYVDAQAKKAFDKEFDSALSISWNRAVAKLGEKCGMLNVAGRWIIEPSFDPALLSPWPIPRLPHWTAKVNEALTEQELFALRRSAQRGSPFGAPA